MLGGLFPELKILLFTICLFVIVHVPCCLACVALSTEVSGTNPELALPG